MVSGYQLSTNVFEFCFLPPVGFTLFKEESFAESLRLFLSAGERCPCGAWVAPAFHIQTSKVDAMKPRHVATPNLRIATPLHSTPRVQATPPSANQQEAPPLSDTPVTAGGDWMDWERVAIALSLGRHATWLSTRVTGGKGKSDIRSGLLWRLQPHAAVWWMDFLYKLKACCLHTCFPSASSHGLGDGLSA